MFRSKSFSRLCIGIVSILTLSVSLQSQQANAPSTSNVPQPATQPAHYQPLREEQALQLLKQCTEAMGKPAPSFSLVIDGTVSDVNSQSQAARPLHVESVGKYRERWTETFSDGAHVATVLEKVGHITVAGKARTLPLSETIVRLPEQIPVYACELGKLRRLMDVRYEGVEEHAGMSVDHIHIGFLDPSRTDRAHFLNAAVADLHVYLDRKTHFAVAVRRNIFSSQSYENHLPYELRYSQFQPVAGVQIPTHIDRLIDGRPFTTISITNAASGAIFNDTNFR